MTIDIPAALAICDAATPGPWEWTEEDQMYGHELVRIAYEDGWHENPILIIETDNGVYPPDDNDAAFIAFARTALPEALNELAQLRRERDEWQQLALAARGREEHLEERTAEAIAEFIETCGAPWAAEFAWEIRSGHWRKEQGK